MLGLILIYAVGKSFYDLAGDYEKNQWLFAILGVASYYGGASLAGLIVIVLIGIFSPGLLESINELLLEIALIPIGLIICSLFYKSLEKRFSNQLSTTNENFSSEILDEDFLK